LASFEIDDGVETNISQAVLASDKSATESLLPTEQAQDNVNAEQQNGTESLDNQALLLQCEQLKTENLRLAQEKQELEKRYRILFKQTEKMKAVLDKLKAGH
jgi:hypothetical protein